MASLFGHIAVSTAIGFTLFPKQARTITLVAAGFCAIAPDLDVLAFKYGIPYGSEWGHRGWTHSLAFALVVGVLIGWVSGALGRMITKDPSTYQTSSLSAWFVLSMASHPLLDMLTNGGLGCALWWPFSADRIFFPWRPIQVSPMSVQDFFSPWGLNVLANEVKWIGFPCVALVWIFKAFRKKG